VGNAVEEPDPKLSVAKVTAVVLANDRLELGETFSFLTKWLCLDGLANIAEPLLAYCARAPVMHRMEQKNSSAFFIFVGFRVPLSKCRS
jgi:hypothetical protein